MRSQPQMSQIDLTQSLFHFKSYENVSGRVGGPHPAARGSWHRAPLRRCAPRQLGVAALLLLEVCPLSTNKTYSLVIINSRFWTVRIEDGVLSGEVNEENDIPGVKIRI